MLRVTEYLRKIARGEPIRQMGGTILIWNLTDHCNLFCDHCYASAKQRDINNVPLDEWLGLIPQLKAAGIKIVVLSGGEPLLRKDLFVIARALKEVGIATSLSTNGLPINAKNIESIKETMDYVGISIDGGEEIHDRFRGKKGAYLKSIAAIRLCQQHGLKVGLRFTITPQTRPSLDHIFGLCETESIPKLYLSHLVYSGRASQLNDLSPEEYRSTMDYVLQKAFHYIDEEIPIDIVTGNNEADAVLLYLAVKERYPDYAEKLFEILKGWGGNQAGSRLINIDAKGNLKPDPFFKVILGNVRETALDEILGQNGFLSKLREHPRKLGGKCGNCPFLTICNGNSRARAYAVSGDYFGEDPACYI